MKDKIIKAIDKGLINALSTDINDQDINFNHDDINANTLISVTSYEEFENILHNNEFLKYDTSEVVTLMTGNGMEIPLHLYKDQKVEYICLKACNENGNHDIILHTDFKASPTSKHWIQQKRLEGDNLLDTVSKLPVRYFSSATEASMDFDSAYNNPFMQYIDYMPALKYCVNQGNKYFKGMIPSFGQMIFIHKYLMLVNTILRLMGKNGMLLNEHEKWWTSSMHQFDMIYTFSITNKYISVNTGLNYVLPIFRKIR